VTVAFDAATHTYTAGGIALPSVTQIIAGAGLMGDTSFWTDEARDRGTHVHTMVALADIGDLDEDTLDPALRPFLDAYRWFQHDHSPKWSLIEAPRYSLTLRYAGTVDRAGFLQDGKHPTVLDVKSGQPAAHHGIQVSAYRRLLSEELGPIVNRAVLHLGADGTYRLTKLPLDDREDWAVFAAALTIESWKRARI